MQDNLILRTYALLFSKPLYTTAKKQENRLRNDILILGSDEAATEAFRAVYWCGQYAPENDLHITVASPEALDFQEMLEEEMPGIAYFPDYATLHFVETRDVMFPGALDELALAQTPFDYIIIALGDTGLNHYAAELLRKELLAAGNTQALVAIIDEEESEAYALYSIPEGKLLRESCVESRKKLDRLAFNIDFTYSLEQNPRASKSEIRGQFDNDPGYGDPAYTAAVHIPYKLALCNGFTGDSDRDMDVFIEAIDTENPLYNQLMAVEHRRWIAYLITCGYRPPSREELEAYAFQNGCDYRDEDNLLHPCMCQCDLTGRHLDEHYPLWGTEEAKWAGLAPLDQMSLLLNQLAGKQAEYFCDHVEEYFSFLRKRSDYSDIKYYENLRLSVLKLCANEENSVGLYMDALADARAAAGRQRDRYVLQALNDLENDFSVLVFRNQKVDFFELDAIRLKRLPFCLWYGEKNRTVITFTKGVLTEDIIVPTLLLAEDAIFIGPNVEGTPYRPAAKEFFRDRGDNTRVTTINFTHNGVGEVTTFLRNLVEKYESPVFNCVDCDDPHILMAVGFIAAEKNIPAIRFDEKKGLVPVLNTAPLGLKLIDERLSIDEFTSLMGGRYKNVYSNITSLADYDTFADIFWTFTQERTRKSITREGEYKLVEYTPWADLSAFFRDAETDREYDLGRGVKMPFTQYRNRFHSEIYRKCGIGNMLQALQNYNVIRDLTEQKQDNLEIVEFTYVDSMLETVLQPFTLQRTEDPEHYADCLTKKAHFYIFHGVIISGLQTERIFMGNPPETEEERKWSKWGFVSTLEEHGMITNVEWLEDQRYVSFRYKDEKVQQIFRTHGKIFELIIYHGMKSSGLFDDVQTSVEISWETNIKSFEVQLQERLVHARGFGYGSLWKEVMQLKRDTSKGAALTGTDNEIDVVLMLGMRPIFISCKTGKTGSGTEWLNEISTLSTHFHALPVLAVLRNLDSAACNFLVSRARRLGVSIVGTETIADPVRWQKAIKALAKGDMVFGPDTKK